MSTLDVRTALCAPFLERLPIAGVSIMIGSVAGARSSIASSDETASELDALQFQLGEGPTLEVFFAGLLLITPDLGDARLRRRWPTFVPLAEEAGAGALFTFPMLLGAMTVGVVSLYERTPVEDWSEELRFTAVQLTESVARPAVALATESAWGDPRPGEQTRELRREVHQAAGMVMVQLDCSIDEAMTRLRAHSYTEGRTLDAVARSVVERTLNFARTDD